MPKEFSLYPPRRAVGTPPLLPAVGHKDLHRCESAGASAGQGPRAAWVAGSELRIRAVRSFGVAAPCWASKAFVRLSAYLSLQTIPDLPGQARKPRFQGIRSAIPARHPQQTAVFLLPGCWACCGKRFYNKPASPVLAVTPILTASIAMPGNA